MTTPFKVACVQNSATADMDASLAEATALVRAARAAGAELICLPEYFTCLGLRDNLLISTPFAEEAHPALPHYRGLAQELGAWLLLGSLAVEAPGGKVVNRSYLLDDGGGIAACYDKIPTTRSTFSTSSWAAARAIGNRRPSHPVPRQY